MPIAAHLYDAVASYCDALIQTAKPLDDGPIAVAAVSALLASRSPTAAASQALASTSSASCDGTLEPAGDNAPLLRLISTVFRQKYGYFCRRTAHLHRRPEALGRYRRLLDSGMCVFDIAWRRDVNYSPYLLCRILLEEIAGMPKPDVSAAAKDVSLISDPRWRAEFEECIAKDRYSGPMVDKSRLLAGTGRESDLCAAMEARRIPYSTEQDLRRQGFSKTPDVRLDLPIGFIGQDGLPHIAHWIDSKAMFGDPDAAADNEDQLLGYVNRFGPGLVIYWLDYVETIAASSPPDIAISNVVPSEWVFPGASELSRFPEAAAVSVISAAAEPGVVSGTGMALIAAAATSTASLSPTV